MSNPAAGKISVFVEHIDKPIMEWTDPDPLPIAYFGFASYDSILNRYFYNCLGEQPIAESQIQSACRQSTANEYEYDQFVPISGDQPAGFLVNLPLYVMAARDAHVMLTPEQTSDGDVYEIRKSENADPNFEQNLIE